MDDDLRVREGQYLSGHVPVLRFLRDKKYDLRDEKAAFVLFKRNGNEITASQVS